MYLVGSCTYASMDDEDKVFLLNGKKFSNLGLIV